eukprot:GFYU01012045.1.p1 GENE.GFYU01012045.1~~GFYU01012045.1.p1  ORF type:complete len:410 (-),score=121.13 GFYU01012045.1:217-1446(-)
MSFLAKQVTFVGASAFRRFHGSLGVASVATRSYVTVQHDGLANVKSSKLVTTKATSLKTKPEKETLVFGRSMSDHMLTIDWNEKAGWDAPQIQPYGPFHLDPAAIVLHYAIEVFEGMKAYKDADGNIRMFRPMENMNRMCNSSARMCMPTFDKAETLECIKELLRVERDWIPEGKGYSLYIRPTMIGTEAAVGVHPPAECRFFTIVCPVGPYYKTGFAPVRLLAETEYNRAFPGGTGDAKAGGNYGPTIYPQMLAASKGYSQVLWLYGQREQVTEVGTMNLFVHWKNEQGEEELVTASLDGTILPGVTRSSIIELAKLRGIKVSERSFYMDEVLAAHADDRIYEAFGAGTAAVVSPINCIGYKGKDYAIPLNKDDPNAKAGKLAQYFWDTLTSIQYGEIEGPEGWSVVV